jgi:hypothetical protein
MAGYGLPWQWAAHGLALNCALILDLGRHDEFLPDAQIHVHRNCCGVYWSCIN